MGKLGNSMGLSTGNTGKIEDCLEVKEKRRRVCLWVCLAGLFCPFLLTFLTPLRADLPLVPLITCWDVWVSFHFSEFVCRQF